jgi:hypothetical protein
LQGDGVLFEVSVGLFIAGPTLAPAMVIDDFTIPTFTGYAPVTAQTFGPAFFDQGGRLQLNSPLVQYVATAVPTPEYVLGYYAWREGAPDILLFADYFDSPVAIQFPDDGIAFTISFEMVLTGHGTYLFSP